MNVIVWSGTDDEDVLTDVAAVVVRDGEARLCFDGGKPDEAMPSECVLVVVP